MPWTPILDVRRLGPTLRGGQSLFVPVFTAICLCIAAVLLLIMPTGEADDLAKRALAAYGALVTLASVSFSATRAVDNDAATVFRRAGQLFLYASLYFVPAASIEYGLLWSVGDLSSLAPSIRLLAGILRLMAWITAGLLFIVSLTATFAAYTLLVATLSKFWDGEMSPPGPNAAANAGVKESNSEARTPTATEPAHLAENALWSAGSAENAVLSPGVVPATSVTGSAVQLGLFVLIAATLASVFRGYHADIRRRHD